MDFTLSCEPLCKDISDLILSPLRIFDIAPGAWALFPFGKGFDEASDEMFQSPSFRAHSKQVVTMLDTAVSFLGPDLEVLADTLVDLGARHVSYGVMPEHYPIVGEALIGTLAAALGEAFTDEVKGAWGGVYGFITTHMLKGANESLLRVSYPLYGSETKEEITLDKYVANMIPGQTELYYVTSIDSDSFDKVKALQDKGIKIVKLPARKAEMIVTNIQKYVGRKMANVNDDNLDLTFLEASEGKINKSRRPSPTAVVDFDDNGLASSVESNDFCAWFQQELGKEKVVKCTPTCGYESQPARVIHHNGDDIAKTVQELQDFDVVPLPKKHVEINPTHKLIVEMNEARYQNPELASLLAQQIYDNCMINAGLMDDGRRTVVRMNTIMMTLLKKTNTESH
jgi:hypothetical protein